MTDPKKTVSRLFPNQPVKNDVDGNPTGDVTVPSIQRGGPAGVIEYAIHSPIPARLWDDLFAFLRVTKSQKGQRTTDDKSTPYALKIFEKHFQVTRGMSESQRPTVRQMIGSVFTFWNWGSVSVENPEDVFEEGSTIDVEIIQGDVRLVNKFKNPTHKDQSRFENLRSKQSMTPQGEVYGRGYIVGAYSLARELWIGSEGYESNSVKDIPVSHLHRSLVAIINAGDDQDVDLGN